jgi:hypothetical protein
LASTCRIGSSLTYDVIAYVRNQIEDTVAPFVVSDAALLIYVENAAEEFSKWEPLGEEIVGNIAGTSGSPPSSPFQTQSYVSRYSCSVANGFAHTPAQIIDVLYRASGVFSAASEIAYLALMPVSPLNWFRIDKDLLNSPSSRHIRDQYLQELDHYGIGYWGVARDSTGLKAIDLYPPPVTAGLPIFVRYTYTHANNSGDPLNPTYPTIPEDLKRYFAKFLLAETIEEEADRLIKRSQTKAGITQRWSSPAEAVRYACELRDRTELAMGSAVSVVKVSW